MRWATPTPPEPTISAGGSPGTTATATGSTWIRRGSSSPRARPAASFSRFSPPSTRAIGVALADPGYPAYRNILSALGIEAVCIPTGPDSRFQPTPRPARRGGPPRRADRGEPCQSDRDDARPRCARRAGRLLRRTRHPAGVRRDLSRDRLRRSGRHRAPSHRRCGDRQQLLEILLDDRLANRLDGGAGRSRPADRMSGPEPLHLAADAGAARGRRGLRLHRRTRCQRRPLRGEPGASARRAAAGRVRTLRAGRRRVLPLCRHRRLRPRQSGTKPPSSRQSGGCRSAPDSISTAAAATATCACPSPAAAKTWARRCPVSTTG